MAIPAVIKPADPRYGSFLLENSMNQILDWCDEHWAKVKCSIGIHDWLVFVNHGSRARICKQCSAKEKEIVILTWIEDTW